MKKVYTDMDVDYALIKFTETAFSLFPFFALIFLAV